MSFCSHTLALFGIVTTIINCVIFTHLHYQESPLGEQVNNNQYGRRLLTLDNSTYNNSIETSDAFHPLDPLSADELSRGVNVAKQYFDINLDDNTILIIHDYQYKFPNKQKVVDFLYNSNTNLDTNDFPRVLDMDISILQNDGIRRKFYNIQIDTRPDYEEIVSIKNISSATGYPRASNVVAPYSVLFDNPEIFEYFTEKLKIPAGDLINMLCIISSPQPQFFISLLKDKIPNIEDIFNNNRIGIIGLCFDQTYIIENYSKNRMPFLAVFNYDTAEILHFWQCDDDEMNLECKVALDYTNKNEYVWTNKINLNDLDQIGLNINDIDNECAAERILKNTANNNTANNMDNIPSSSNTRDINIVSNNQIKWDKWSFHSQFNKREGPRLSDIRFLNRSIIYELKLSEIYVPYYDFNSILIHSYSFLDLGQYSFGPSILGETECPKNSIFLQQDSVLNDDGSITQSPPFACLFERNTKFPRMRHGGFPYANTAPNVELVYRTVLTTGYYDYLISYIFKLDGSIKLNVATGGMDAVSSVINKNSPNNNKYCNLLSENYCAMFHDHFFGFRIDIDVDEYNNKFYHGELKKKKIQIDDNKVSHGWYYHERLIKKESHATDTLNPQHPHRWVFRSTSNKYFNKNIRSQSGYEIVPQSQNVLLWRPVNDVRDNQGSWSNKGIWVSKYDEDELYISGRYTWQPIPNQGVREYIKNNDRIDKDDVVAWVTLGFHHVTRSEDLPTITMPSHDINIQPFNFFEYTPASCGNDII